MTRDVGKRGVSRGNSTERVSSPINSKTMGRSEDGETEDGEMGGNRFYTFLGDVLGAISGLSASCPAIVRIQSSKPFDRPN